MFPIGDSVPYRARPIALLSLIAVNAIAFAYQLGLAGDAQSRFLLEYALVPRRYFFPLWASSQELVWLDPTPFFTSMFLHGGFLHIAMNLWMLWIFGRAVEDRLGPYRFLVLYFGAGLLAGLAHTIFNATSAIPTLGASGAIAGVIAAYTLRFPTAWLRVVVPIFIFPFFFAVPAMFFAAVWFGMQILQGVSEMLMPWYGQGIAWWAHIGGFIGGWLLISPLSRSSKDKVRF